MGNPCVQLGLSIASIDYQRLFTIVKSHFHMGYIWIYDIYIYGGKPNDKPPPILPYMGVKWFFHGSFQVGISKWLVIFGGVHRDKGISFHVSYQHSSEGTRHASRYRHDWWLVGSSGLPFWRRYLWKIHVWQLLGLRNQPVSMCLISYVHRHQGCFCFQSCPESVAGPWDGELKMSSLVSFLWCEKIIHT